MAGIRSGYQFDRLVLLVHLPGEMGVPRTEDLICHNPLSAPVVSLSRPSFPAQAPFSMTGTRRFAPLGKSSLLTRRFSPGPKSFSMRTSRSSRAGELCRRNGDDPLRHADDHLGLTEDRRRLQEDHFHQDEDLLCVGEDLRPDSWMPREINELEALLTRRSSSPSRRSSRARK